MSAALLGSTISYQLGWPLRVIGIVGSLGLLLFIFELVRRRQLKEEYTVLWVITGLVLLLLAAWEPLLRTIAEAIGASSEASMLYFFGLIFVVALLLHFSVRVSRLERRVTSMMQEIGLLGAAKPNGALNGAGEGADARQDLREEGAVLQEGGQEASERAVGGSREGPVAERAAR
jgi:hypothetical protein